MSRRTLDRALVVLARSPDRFRGDLLAKLPGHTAVATIRDGNIAVAFLPGGPRSGRLVTAFAGESGEAVFTGSRLRAALR